jgi:hypothetical protein
MPLWIVELVLSQRDVELIEAVCTRCRSALMGIYKVGFPPKRGKDREEIKMGPKIYEKAVLEENEIYED